VRTFEFEVIITKLKATSRVHTGRKSWNKRHQTDNSNKKGTMRRSNISLYACVLLVADTWTGSVSFAAAPERIRPNKSSILPRNNSGKESSLPSKPPLLTRQRTRLIHPNACKATPTLLKMTGGSSASSSSSSSSPPKNRDFKWWGRSILLLVSGLYGALNVCLRRMYALEVPPSAPALSSSSGILAAMCFLPVFFAKSNSSSSNSNNNKNKNSINTTVADKKPTRTLLWMTAFELALWHFLGQGFINIGLLTCPSARASFLIQSSVIFTPIISSIFGHHIPPQVWLATLLAFGGLTIISFEGGGGVSTVSTVASAATEAATITAHSAGLTIPSLQGMLGRIWKGIKSVPTGDAFVVSGALSWSMYLVRLSRASSAENNRHGADFPPMPLQAIKTLLLATMYTCWWALKTSLTKSPPTNMVWWTSPKAWAILIFCAIFPGALADVLQQKGQEHVSAAETNIIQSTEPVFTAVFGLFLLGERVAIHELTGGFLILLAGLLSSLKL